MRLISPAIASLALLVCSSPARAEDVPPAPPPPPPPPTSAQYDGGSESSPVLSARELRHWRDGDPVPPGYHPVQKTRDGLVIAGVTVFAIPYFFSAVGALASHNSEDQVLYAPAAGPFLRMGDNDASSNVADLLADVLLVMDGLAQTAGITMLILGSTTTKTVLVRDDMVSMPVIVPLRFAGNGYGVGLAAQF